jgi:hypothetical protein
VATLVLGGLGATVGSAVGGGSGAKFGFSVGATLAGVLFPPKLKPQERGKLDDLRLTSSAYGAIIPMVFGCARVGGVIIWATELVERVSKKKVGGKGAPRQTVKNYTYFANIAVLVCEGPVGQVRRIWAEDRLIHDPQGLSGPAIPQPDWLEIYLGTEEQNPSPLIESFKGVGNVPAYRGWCYTTMELMPLAPYGNRLPSLEFEVCPVEPAESGMLLAYKFESGAFLENTGSFAGADLTEEEFCNA